MSKNYWLHRITGGENASQFSYPLLFNHNLLSIGWCEFSTDEYLESFKKQGIAAIDRAIDEVWKEGFRPKNRYNLYRFVCEMKKGDVVLVPTWGEFSLFEIIDDKILSNESVDRSLFIDGEGGSVSFVDGFLRNADDKIVDLGFYRKVRPLFLGIPRMNYADNALYSRMKIRQTNADISDLSESVDSAVRNYKDNKPIDLKKEIVDETVDLILGKITKLSKDAQFERLVRWYFEVFGGNVETPSKNESPTEEGDADVVAYFDNLKLAIMVQVKLHHDITGDWAVQQVEAFNHNHKYGDYSTQMWVVSTCDDYSDDAKRLAEESDVRLINGKEFCRMILDAGLKNFPV